MSTYLNMLWINTKQISEHFLFYFCCVAYLSPFEHSIAKETSTISRSHSKLTSNAHVHVFVAFVIVLNPFYSVCIFTLLFQAKKKYTRILLEKKIIFISNCTWSRAKKNITFVLYRTSQPSMFSEHKLFVFVMLSTLNPF